MRWMRDHWADYLVCLLRGHDWRYASHAPGWKLGDDCVMCERCKIRRVHVQSGR